MGVAIFILIVLAVLLINLVPKKVTITHKIELPKIEPVQEKTFEELHCYEGRKLTPEEESICNEAMYRYFERFPNSVFWEQHPEYVDKYLKEKIDLDLPDGVRPAED